MPSVTHTLFFAVQAAALSALVFAPLAPAAAMANPIPMPLPLMPADYYRTSNRSAAGFRKSSVRNRKSSRVKHLAASNDADKAITRRGSRLTLDKFTSRMSLKSRRAGAGSPDPYNEINKYATAANTHSQNLKELAAQSSTVPDSGSSDFEAQAASQLTSFHQSLVGLEAVLKQLGADKGLANYDRTNDVETLLKNTVNTNKNTLSYVTTISYNLPIVGHTLGPIVYEIKCILDDILDACENLTDAILNVLQPLLAPLIGKYLTSACNNGIGLPTCLLG